MRTYFSHNVCFYQVLRDTSVSTLNSYPIIQKQRWLEFKPVPLESTRCLAKQNHIYLRTRTTSTEIVDLWHCYKTRFFSFENTFFVTMYTFVDSRKEFSPDQTFLYIYLTYSQWCFRARQASEMMFSPTKSNQQLQVQVITDLN